ncbi:hypothetical protein [Paenibacillus sp. J22TS3]|uniref:hypothetical protein n=1 Tax=Paenibacillus sp. J22TS3 TaxID=2807192 RepID=UPI001B074751|nr:hypothetical protein [Paenibacillus sp. J22TS3]GIP22904.1 hypothetical protein J22TS3_31790 [Paenibacillus sp. J22TS3]
MTSKFHSLVNYLNAELFVFIENEFEVRDKPEEILSWLILMPIQDKNLLVEELKIVDSVELSDEFNDMFNEFSKVEIDDTQYELINAGELELALEDSKYEFLLNKIKYLKEILEPIMEKNYELKPLFLKYGCGIYPLYCDDILSEITTPRRSIRIYKSLPEVKSFLEQVEERLTTSQFCVCIVDKAIDNEMEAGVNFVRSLLEQRDKKREKGHSVVNIASVIFTSNEEVSQPKSREDYFIIQTSKSEINSMAKGLALCAYTEVFDKLKYIHQESIESATNVAWTRKENVRYLIEMANIEGITPFEAIQYWFKLNIENGISRKLIQGQADTQNQYKYVIGLTHFLNEEWIDIYEDAHFELETEFQELNTFEIFDYTVNLQHLPPAPGDIFKINDTYRVLVGQDCDFIVRQKEKGILRNAKNADLLKATFEHNGSVDKITHGSNEIKINHFKNSDGRIGKLNISFNGQETSDFLLLDTCAFNQDGNCEILLNEDLREDVKRLLPSFWHDYYKTIQLKILKAKEVNDKVKDLELLKNNNKTIFDYQINGNKITFPFKRVCRIKKEFRDVILKFYWNYRGRSGINTIGNTIGQEINIPKFIYGTPGNFSEKENFGEFQTYQVKYSANQETIIVLNLQSCLRHIQFLRDIESEQIVIKDESYIDEKTNISFEKIKDDSGEIISLKIVRPLVVENTGNFIVRDYFNFSELLTREQIERLTVLGNFTFSDFNSQSHTMKDENMLFIELPIHVLRSGIRILSLGVEFYLNRTKISCREIDINQVAK